MKKAFLDKDIFTKQWFRQLTAKEKVVWLFIVSNCSFDGFWEYDPQRIEFECNGFNGEIPEIIKEKLGMISVDDTQYLLKNYISFQYGTLKPQAVVHKRIIERIVNKGLDQHFPELVEDF